MLARIARAVGPASLALATVLYLFTTWVPRAVETRDRVCISLLAAALGAGVVHVAGSSRKSAFVGALVMLGGVAAAVAALAW